MRSIIVAVLIGVVLTVLFFALGALFSGGGHDLTAITVFFPYAEIFGGLTKDTLWDRIGGVVGMALLGLQFPVYAIILTRIKGWRSRTVTFLILFAVHVAATVVGLQIYHRSDSNRNYRTIGQNAVWYRRGI
jgi:hypothetical protein